VWTQLPEHVVLALRQRWGLTATPDEEQAAFMGCHYMMTRSICRRCSHEEVWARLFGVAGYHWAPFASLPSSALLRIFELFCDSCGPEAPGICFLSGVCRQWRDAACSVKGLKVLFQGEGPREVFSFSAWLLRHMPQVYMLAITSWIDPWIMDAPLGNVDHSSSSSSSGRDRPQHDPVRAAVMAAAAAGGTLPLQRLVITGMRLMRSRACMLVLRAVLAALPHLRHLHLALCVEEQCFYDLPSLADAAAATLAPLQHSTSLTSLVLDGPWLPGHNSLSQAAHVRLLESLPCGLRSLSWTPCQLNDPGGLSFDHLSALTHLSLYDVGRHVSSASLIPDGAFTGLPQLQQLQLLGARVSDQLLVAHKEQLVGLAARDTPGVLGQLIHLKALNLGPQAATQELLQQAPRVQELSLQLPDDPSLWDEGWSTPWVLQHYPGLTGLQRLSLTVGTNSPAPQGLWDLTQLKQLAISTCAPGHNPPALRQQACTLWATGLPLLTNLEVLIVPAGLTTGCCFWLTALTRLVVLEVCGFVAKEAMPRAANHISRLVALDPAKSSSSGTGSGGRAGVHTQAARVQVVCFSPAGCVEPMQLQQAVRAAMPVLSPGKHLFRGSWEVLQQCGVKLWPEPVATRLQQLMS
jgi:hypothetical protein